MLESIKSIKGLHYLRLREMKSFIMIIIKGKLKMKVVDHPVITLLLAVVLVINSFCCMAVAVKIFFELRTITFGSLFELVMYLFISYAGYTLSIRKFREVQITRKKLNEK